MIAHDAILAAIVTRLRQSPAVADIVAARVWNHAPTDAQLPFLIVRWEPVEALHGQGYECWRGDVRVTARSDASGDAAALALATAAAEALHLQPAGIPGATCITAEEIAVVTESDGVIHQAESRLSLIVSD